MENKTPKFQRPNPEGAKSKSKIVRAAGKIGRVVSTIDLSDGSRVRVLQANGHIQECRQAEVKPAMEGDEERFNAAYQRHLRKQDADNIKHPKK